MYDTWIYVSGIIDRTKDGSVCLGLYAFHRDHEIKDVALVLESLSHLRASKSGSSFSAEQVALGLIILPTPFPFDLYIEQTWCFFPLLR